MGSAGHRLLVADSRFAAGDHTLLGRFAASGYEVVVNPYGRRLSPEELIQMGAMCEGIIAGSESYTDEILARLPVLRCISRVGVGTDRIDLDACQRRGIRVCVTPEAPTHAVAEHTVALMLALTRGIPQMDRAIRAGHWTPHLGRGLADLRIGVVGFGRIGRAVAARLRPWRCTLTVTDVVDIGAAAGEAGAAVADLSVLLAGSDLVSLHLPHTPETHHLISASALAVMPRGAMLVNTSRGGLVDEAALYAALLDGRLGGAALDVFEEEPYQGPLAALPNVVLTAHAASHTLATRRQMEREAAENLYTALLSASGS